MLKNENFSCFQMIRCCIYYIPINDTTLDLPVFWPSDTESGINELRFSESISLSFKTRLRWLPAFAAKLRKVNFKHGTREGKHDDKRNGKRSCNFSGLMAKTIYKIKIM